VATEIYLSPDVDNYTMPTGELYFTREGQTEEVHMGNASKVELNLDVKLAQHYSSMGGIRRKDKTVVTEAEATFKATLDEWTPTNIALALLADTTSNTEEDAVLEIGAAELVYGSIRFSAKNDIGRRVNYVLPSVAIKPGKALALVDDGFSVIDIEGDVQATKVGNKYRFGTATFVQTENITE
jgi:hypothetical protein